MNAWFNRIFVIRSGDSVRYSGIEHNSKSQVIAEEGDMLIVKWSGGYHWSGRGLQSYHSPSIDVLQKIKGDKQGCYRRLISWETGRKKRG